MIAEISGIAGVLGRTNPETGFIDLLGTCFPVSSNLLATAAHVTGPSDVGLQLIASRIQSLSDYQDTTDNQVNTTPLTLVRYDPIHDISLLTTQGLDARFTYQLGSTDEVRVGAKVFSLGYPHANHGRMVLTAQSSTVGARIFLGTHGIKVKHVVLNSQTRPGQSGGPVFTEIGAKVIGMIVGGFMPPGGSIMTIGDLDPHTLHQTTHVVSAEYIRALIS